VISLFHGNGGRHPPIPKNKIIFKKIHIILKNWVKKITGILHFCVVHTFPNIAPILTKPVPIESRE